MAYTSEERAERKRTNNLKWYHTHKEKRKDKIRAYGRRIREVPEHRAKHLLYDARRRNPVGFTATVERIARTIEEGRCEITGLPFDLVGPPRSPFVPSLDRSDNAIGYTEENVKVVVWCYNSAKGSGTHADVLRLTEALACTAKRN